MVMHMLSEGMKTRRSLNPYPYLAFFNRPRMRNERFLLRDRKFSALSRLMVYMLAHKEARSSRAAANVKFDTEHNTRPQSMNSLFTLLIRALLLERPTVLLNVLLSSLLQTPLPSQRPYIDIPAVGSRSLYRCIIGSER